MQEAGMAGDNPAGNSDRHNLVLEGKDIVLLGTAHVSRESADMVERVIHEVNPDTVCVELCRSRHTAITQKDKWRETDLIKVIKEKKAFLLLSNLMLSSFQKKIARKFGVRPGEEMLKAMETAEALGATVHLADREIRVTLSRAWRAMGFWAKLKLMTQFILSLGKTDEISEKEIEEMKKKDVLEALLSEISEAMPGLRRILIDERDQYLAEKIRTAPGQKIVAVVGAGHVPGIKLNWNREVDMEALEQVPPRSRLFSLLKWGVPCFVAGLIVCGFFMAGASGGTDMVKTWIVANGLLAGLGAVAALAHPVTIVSALLASPLTSLNPMIAAGWVAGLVEIFVGRPKVKDFEGLSEDISSAGGFWKNKITRILLVVVFTNIGSSLGAFVAIPFMARVFAP